MLTLNLVYDPHTPGTAGGWYLPANDLPAWLAAAVRAPTSSTKFYLAPRSLSDQTAVGLIALHAGPSQVTQSVPIGAVPLVITQGKPSGVELWMPLFTKLSLPIPSAELLANEELQAAQRYVWLPPDDSGQPRLIGLTTEDEIDLSILVKPNRAPAYEAKWFAPPRVPRLPEHAMELQIARELFQANPFGQEQESIGGESDDLMSLDDEGKPSGGGLGAMTGRMLRQGLEKMMKALQARQKPTGTSKGEPPRKSGQAQPASQPSQGSSYPQLAKALYQKLQQLLAGQREQQLKKLLALMARDPDRALRYAVPMANQGAPRGLAQPGAELGNRNADFSLTELFGGGQPVDPWQIDYQLQAQLMAAYRSQADREMAAGRYRRAAYVYAHLIGDMSAAAMVLEKGKFFIEASALYQKLNRPLDQARCLRGSGQLLEAAKIYEDLKHYESAAEMWSGVGDRAAAMLAYEKACAAAIDRREILKAVNILDKHLVDPARAEQLLWSQWPRGQQVFECMKLAFKRLADQNRMADAQRHFDELVGATEREEQTLLAKLSSELSMSFPDRALRSRAEDQCRLSAVDRLTRLSSVEFQQRMQILGGLHPDDQLLQRDIRRFEREQQSRELQLQPDTTDPRERGKLRELTSVRLADGQYCAAMMIGQHLFTMFTSKSSMQLSRYAGIANESPTAIHGWIHLDLWDLQQPPCCHFAPGSDPVYIYAGYGKSQPESQLLTSPLGGDDFWIVHSVSSSDGVLAGLTGDGSQWWWNSDQFQLTLKRNGLPHVLSLTEWIREQLPEIVVDTVFTQPANLALVMGNKCFVGWHKRIASVTFGQPPQTIATFSSPIQWMIPSLPQTLPRLLVATEHELWIVPANAGGRSEKIIQDERFSAAAFLPGGHIAAATDRELLLFQRGRQAMKLIDRRSLLTPHVVSILSLTARSVGVLYKHGVLQRLRIS